MGNTGKVLKSDGNPPTPKELAEGRGTHLDYTVYDANGNVMGLETAKAFAGMGQTPFAQSAGAGQQLATTPQWQIEAQQKAQEQSMKAMEEAQKLAEASKKEQQAQVRQILDSSKTGQIIQGQTLLAKNIQKVIDFIEKNSCILDKTYNMSVLLSCFNSLGSSFGCLHY